MIDYNRILIVGHCEATKNFILNTLAHYNHIIIKDPNLSTCNDFTIDILKFIGEPLPLNTVLISHTHYPKLLNRLDSNVFNNWKFVFVNRNPCDAFATYRLREPTQINTERAIDVTIQLNVFYEKIKHRCITVEYNDIIKNSETVINKLFKFLSLDPPNKEIIKKNYFRDPLISRAIKLKIKPGNEFYELCERDVREEFIDGFKYENSLITQNKR